ncbi:hypothetical protein OQA88_5235 [Cercophora sp. LCS_1]
MTATYDNGIGRDQETDARSAFIIGCFLVIALYNVLELNVIIFSVFKTYRSLYFWSFLVATWGIPLYAAGFLLKFVDVSRARVAIVVLISVGWVCMVSGQSLVLYSRLHLVLWNETYLRLVLAMIICDAIICHVPTIVIAAGANLTDIASFVTAYSIYEKVQVTIFFIQELIISSLYISRAVKLLGPDGEHVRGKAAYSVKVHLLLVNMCVIFLDIAVLALEYASLYNIQISYKAFAYSIKLKLEFSILNRLVDFARLKKQLETLATGVPEESSLVAPNSEGHRRVMYESTGTTLDVYAEEERESATASCFSRNGERQPGKDGLVVSQAAAGKID